MLIAALATFAAAAPGLAQDDRICTEIGCSSGVTVQSSDLHRTAPGWRTVTVCVDDRCRRTRRGSGGPLIAMVEDRSLTGPRTVRVRVVVRGRDGRRLLRRERRVALRRTQPNGPGCEPVCWQASLRLHRGRLTTA